MASARATHGGARAFGLAPRRGALAGVLLLAVALGALALLAGGHGRASTSSKARYGGLPSWLPKATAPVGRIVNATPAQPTLAIEGDTVAVRLVSGSVYATAVGPRVPKSGAFPVPPTSPCTFILTLARAAGAIPIRPADLTITDEQGHLHHPAVTTLSGAAPASQITPGKPVSLEIHAVLPTGSGSLSWAPERGRPLVSWDFSVEID
jgi:hypothetical protein